MFSNCPTPPLKKYINLKGLPNKTFSCIWCNWHRMHDCCVRKSITSRRIRSRIQKGCSPWIRGPVGIVWWKNRGPKISWHCPFNRKHHTVVWILLRGIQFAHFQRFWDSVLKFNFYLIFFLNMRLWVGVALARSAFGARTFLIILQQYGSGAIGLNTLNTCTVGWTNVELNTT
jgi:hypothetical protein